MCPYCGDPVALERIAIGKTHCMKRECVAAWRRGRIEDNGLHLVMVPKQGMTWLASGERAPGRASGK